MVLSAEQGRFPLFLSEKLNIFDPAVIVNDLVEKENLGKYLKNKRTYGRGRIGYNSVDLLKVVLFAFCNTFINICITIINNSLIISVNYGIFN